MKTIHKFVLRKEDRQVIDIPGYQQALSVGLDANRQLCMWAEVDTNSFVVAQLVVFIVGTGHPLPTTREWEMKVFIGTVLDTPFVWHLYFKV